MVPLQTPTIITAPSLWPQAAPPTLTRFPHLWPEGRARPICPGSCGNTRPSDRHFGKRETCSRHTSSFPPRGGRTSVRALGTLPALCQITQAAPPVTAAAARTPAAAGTGGPADCAARAAPPLPAEAPGNLASRASGDKTVCYDPPGCSPPGKLWASPENRNFKTSTFCWLALFPLPCFHVRGTGRLC